MDRLKLESFWNVGTENHIQLQMNLEIACSIWPYQRNVTSYFNSFSIQLGFRSPFKVLDIESGVQEESVYLTKCYVRGALAFTIFHSPSLRVFTREGLLMGNVTPCYRACNCQPPQWSNGLPRPHDLNTITGNYTLCHYHYCLSCHAVVCILPFTLDKLKEVWQHKCCIWRFALNMSICCFCQPMFLRLLNLSSFNCF